MTGSDTETRILQAATEAFLEKGKDGARMQDIARRAGINQALLHYYFRSKDRLYDVVLSRVIQTFLDRILVSIPPTDDIPTLLRTFIDHYINEIGRNHQMIRFVLWEIERGGELFVREARKVFRRHGFSGPPFVQVIETAVAEGKIRAVDPVHLVLSLLGMCVYPFIARPIVQKIFGIPSVFDPDFLARRKAEIFDLVWTGIRPDGAAGG